MKKYTIALIMLLSFLVSSRLIYKERFYASSNTTGIEEVGKEYYYKIPSIAQVGIEKEYDYEMGGIISLSVGLLLIGLNHFINKKTKYKDSDDFEDWRY
jgi:hypothetical protein